MSRGQLGSASVIQVHPVSAGVSLFSWGQPSQPRSADVSWIQQAVNRGQMGSARFSWDQLGSAGVRWVCRDQSRSAMVCWGQLGQIGSDGVIRSAVVSHGQPGSAGFSQCQLGLVGFTWGQPGQSGSDSRLIPGAPE